MEMKNIAVGSTININRSDGRIHPAIVVAVNLDGNFIRVEWFENGENKGKDLDFRVAAMLNPELKYKEVEISPPSAKQSVDDCMVNKNQRRGIPVNNRRTNVGKKRAPSTSVISELATPAALMSKLHTSRSQTQNTIIEDLNKYGSNRAEKRQKQPLTMKENIANKKTQNQNKQLATMVAECRGKLTFDPIAKDDIVEDHLITVCVRKRPLNKFEQGKNEVDILSVPRKKLLIVHEPKSKVDLTKYIENHHFKFDYAFDDKCNNAMVYKYTAQPLVKTIFEGGFATCFAYGQTGSGKTHTMSGDVTGVDVGIYGLAISDVFKMINSSKYKHLNLTVSCSFFEIYSGKVLDLLNAKSLLKILEDGNQQVQVVGLKEKHVISTEEVLGLINKGNVLRTSGQTSANTNSSRSHAVFQIYLRNNGVVHGKLSLIDLAGNERGADTFQSDRQVRLEGGEINKSLLALKECIRALGRKGAHLPFRVSKLTQVLRDSFVGNKSRTCMIAMVSPGVGSCENTLNTLRYADRVKELGSGDHNNDYNLVNGKMDNSNMSAVNYIERVDNSKHLMELQYAENRLFDSHRSIISKLSESQKEVQQLLKSKNDYENDKKFYADKLEHLVDAAISNLLVTKDCIDDFKLKLSKF